MKTKDIISNGLISFEVIVEFIEKDIDFEVLKEEPHKSKSVVDGKKASFEIAMSLLTKIKQLQEQEGVFKEDEYKGYLMKLVKATNSLDDEVAKVMVAKIEVDDTDDVKVKSIAESKLISFDLLLGAKSVTDDIKFKVKNNQSLSGSGNRNFATDRVKGKE